MTTPKPFLRISFLAGVLLAWLSHASAQTNPSPIFITRQPEPLLVAPGGEIVLRVEAKGPGPLEYSWSRDMVELGVYAPVLRVAAAKSSDVGTYRVRVSSPSDVAGVWSEAAVVQLRVPPAIVEQPQGGSVAAGTPWAFRVRAQGPGPFSYQWRKGGLNLPVFGDRLELRAVSPDDSGTYLVAISNPFGSVLSTAALLHVSETSDTPEVVMPPMPMTTRVGGAATFSVAARVPSGSTPAYQWRKNGMAIPGESGPSLSLMNVQLSDAGAYSVLIKSGTSWVTSSEARLTVTEPMSPTFPVVIEREKPDDPRSPRR